MNLQKNLSVLQRGGLNISQTYNSASIFEKIKDSTFESMRPRVRICEIFIYIINYRKIIILKYRSISICY